MIPKLGNHALFMFQSDSSTPKMAVLGENTQVLKLVSWLAGLQPAPAILLRHIQHKIVVFADSQSLTAQCKKLNHFMNHNIKTWSF